MRSIPFATGGRLLLATDNHNSVNRIREFARRAGTDVDYAPITPPDLYLDKQRLREMLDRPSSGRKLFAYLAQST